MRRDERPIRCH